jgi:hypothetical protein
MSLQNIAVRVEPGTKLKVSVLPRWKEHGVEISPAFEEFCGKILTIKKKYIGGMVSFEETDIRAFPNILVFSPIREKQEVLVGDLI